MNGTVDVDGLLGSGEAAVTDFDTLLAACVALGYQYSGPSLRERYGAEYGLDLRALDADCRALTAAADAADDALLLQHNVSQSVSASWSGVGGAAAGEFLQRHDGSARTVVTGMRQAAAGLARLHDELSRAVEAKIAAVHDASDQMSGYREVWLSAAHAVLGGGGEQDVASEIVDQQVKPFVDAVVCGQLIPALRRCSDSVAAAYASALGTLDGAPVIFDVPGDFGTPSDSAGWGAAPAIGTAASAVPSSWIAPQQVSSPSDVVPVAAAAPASAMPAATAPAATVPAAADPPVTAAAAPLDAPASSMPTDLGLGSAAGGLGRQLTDALGGLLGSAAGLAPDTAGLGDLADGLDDLDRSDDADDPDVTDDAMDDDADDDADDGDTDDPEDAEPVSPVSDQATPDQPPAPADAAVAQPQTDAATPSDAPPPTPVERPAESPAQPVAAEAAEPATAETPCQIAADELPQVGE